MNLEDLQAYAGDKKGCEVCRKEFSPGQVITVGSDGAAVCYTDGDGGCGLTYIFTTGKMFLGAPMVFKSSGPSAEKKAEAVDSPLSGLGKILCLIGSHDPESDPSHKDPFKETGKSDSELSEVVQKGVKNCLRAECPAKIKVWRKGWAAAGSDLASWLIKEGESTPWKRLSRRQEAHIDSLPTMQGG